MKLLPFCVVVTDATDASPREFDRPGCAATKFIPETLIVWLPFWSMDTDRPPEKIEPSLIVTVTAVTNVPADDVCDIDGFDGENDIEIGTGLDVGPVEALS